MLTQEFTSATEAHDLEITSAAEARNLVSQWSQEAHFYLSAVVGQWHRKKRVTLLRLAEAAYVNRPQSAVFAMPRCASKVAHYKWRQVDPAYEAAYMHLVGDHDRPGVARLAREATLDEAERRAIGALDEARTGLRLASATAVDTLRSALSADTKDGDPAWRERIVAANSILDRADTETAARSAINVTTVEDAIAKVYGQDQLTGKPAAPAALSAGDVIEGVVEPATPNPDDDGYMRVVGAGQPADQSAVVGDGTDSTRQSGVQASPHNALMWDDDKGWVEQATQGATLLDDQLTRSTADEPADETNNKSGETTS